MKRKADAQGLPSTSKSPGRQPLVAGWLTPEIAGLMIEYKAACVTQEGDPEKGSHRLKAQLVGLWTHWQATKNHYFAVEALAVTTRIGFLPPRWAIEALYKGLVTHLKNPKGDIAVHIGLRRRGSGKTQPWEKYLARQKLERAMHDMHTLCEFCGISAAKATEAVIGKHELPQKWETLVKYYNATWRPFYLTFGTNPLRLTTEELHAFRNTFPKNLRYLVAKVRTTNSV